MIKTYKVLFSKSMSNYQWFNNGETVIGEIYPNTEFNHLNLLKITVTPFTSSIVFNTSFEYLPDVPTLYVRIKHARKDGHVDILYEKEGDGQEYKIRPTGDEAPNWMGEAGSNLFEVTMSTAPLPEVLPQESITEIYEASMYTTVDNRSSCQLQIPQGVGIFVQGDTAKLRYLSAENYTTCMIYLSAFNGEGADDKPIGIHTVHVKVVKGELSLIYNDLTWDTTYNHYVKVIEQEEYFQLRDSTDAEGFTGGYEVHVSTEPFSGGDEPDPPPTATDMEVHWTGTNHIVTYKGKSYLLHYQPDYTNNSFRELYYSSLNESNSYKILQDGIKKALSVALIDRIKQYIENNFKT